MGQIRVEVSQVIDAPPETIYDIVSDYREGHPAILPKPYFSEMTVEKGGKGAGTVVQVRMNVMGAVRTFRMEISEPQPGRVLVERDKEAGVTTTFTFEPTHNGMQTRVTISTDAAASPGIKGWVEKLLNPPITRRIYKKELQQLAAYARSKAASGRCELEP